MWETKPRDFAHRARTFSLFFFLGQRAREFVDDVTLEKHGNTLAFVIALSFRTGRPAIQPSLFSEMCVPGGPGSPRQQVTTINRASQYLCDKLARE